MPQPPRELKPWAGIREFFGAEVRHWRQAKGLTQDELGCRLNLRGRLIPHSAGSCSGVMKLSGRVPTVSSLGVLCQLHDDVAQIVPF
jgi:transcriptional regulator with XRE-family HTH domain